MDEPTLAWIGRAFLLTMRALERGDYVRANRLDDAVMAVARYYGR